MSASHGPAPEQPKSFVFTAENLERAKRIIGKYPAGRQQSAVIPLLDLAQRQVGWLTKPAIEVIGKMLDMAAIRVLEVATFYTMFNLSPVGKTHVQVCTSLSCWLRGSNDVVKACKEKLGIGMSECSADGQYSLGELECAGACVNAPMLQVGDDYYEDLTPETTVKVLDALARGEKPTPGNQSKRLTSSPEGGFTTLLDTAKGSD